MRRYVITFLALLLLDVAVVWWICFVYIRPVEDVRVVSGENQTVTVEWSADSQKQNMVYCIYGSGDGKDFKRLGTTEENRWNIDGETGDICCIQIRKKYMGVEGKASKVFPVIAKTNHGEEIHG